MTIWLGIQTGMIALCNTLGITFTRRVTSWETSGYHRSAITGILRELRLPRSPNLADASRILDLFNFILDGIFTEVHFMDKWKYYNRVEQVINVFLNYIIVKSDSTKEITHLVLDNK